MVGQGGIAQALARLAVEQVTRIPTTQPSAPRPHIDTRSNTIQTPDHRVDVVLTLDQPQVVVLRNVLTHAECDALTDMAAQRQQRSTVVDTAKGSLQVHAERTSYGAMFQRAENALIERIESRLALLCHWPTDHAEGLQVLRYGPGDEYRPHYDWFDPEQPGPRKHMAHGGQRVGTLVMYLTEVEAGGGTSFPHAGLVVRPQKGGAVFFANVDKSGQPDRATLHAGQPVVQGSKVIATQWLRERRY